MSSSTPPRPVVAAVVLPLVLGVLVPRPGAAQMMSNLAPVSLGARCSAEAIPTPRIRVVQRALADPTDPSVRQPLVALYDSLVVDVQADPHDVETRFLLAVVMGARSEVNSGKAQLEWAERMGEVAEGVLKQEPDHPGAMHLMGRLHAAVLRMGTVKRWVARALFGGEILGDATWTEARQLLEAAERHAPCVPDHHYELAALYRDTGYPEAAAREAQHALEVAALDPAFHGVTRKARALLAERETGSG